MYLQWSLAFDFYFYLSSSWSEWIWVLHIRRYVGDIKHISVRCVCVCFQLLHLFVHRLHCPECLGNHWIPFSSDSVARSNSKPVQAKHVVSSCTCIRVYICIYTVHGKNLNVLLSKRFFFFPLLILFCFYHQTLFVTVAALPWRLPPPALWACYPSRTVGSHRSQTAWEVKRKMP